ncbi:ClbS/DfsB family four-helix bundle protein [Mesoplasma chauliocola]|nr:ClbS/DfsB family four-helix bundle protein [Mesoplasma chauliocola]
MRLIRKTGKEVKTPTPEYKWNDLDNLYNSFYEKY